MRLKNSVYTRTIDTETGEEKLIEQTKIFSTKVKSDSFYYTYIEHMEKILNLTKNSDKKVIAYLCSNMQYNTNVINYDNKLVAAKCNISKYEVSKSLARLVETGILTKVESSSRSYIVNPLLYWKGDQATRDKIIKGVEIQFKLIFDESEL